VTKHAEACCSSPAAMCYWFIVSLIAWGVLSLIGIYWRPLHASSEAACLFAMAIGCFANWLRNRSFHCAITGPVFRDRWRRIPTLRHAPDQRQHLMGLAIRSHWRRHRVSAGMAVCDAFRLLTVEKSPHTHNPRGFRRGVVRAGEDLSTTTPSPGHEGNGHLTTTTAASPLYRSSLYLFSCRWLRPSLTCRPWRWSCA
jgi:hypothetical protein